MSEPELLSVEDTLLIHDEQIEESAEFVIKVCLNQP